MTLQHTAVAWMEACDLTNNKDLSLMERSNATRFLLSSKSDSIATAKLLLTIILVASLQFGLSNTAFAEPENPRLSNVKCLKCHGKENYSKPGADGEQRALHITGEKFDQSVHGKQDCVSCHLDITKTKHKKGVERKVSCVKCHTELWDEVQQQGTMEDNIRLGVVIEKIDSYMGSMHARPSIEDQSRTNATCYNCHDAHYITPTDTVTNPESRLKTPYICGQCHVEQLDAYMTSVHGKEIGSGNTDAAVCSDCHNAHSVAKTNGLTGRLAITKSCGNCHEEKLATYDNTYHGKITQLGYGETAKCYDCHGSHGIKRVDDEASMVHNGNRLKTCQNCHEGATEGFVTFQPHGKVDDFENYPEMWLASKFMIGLLLSTFAFFWLHSALWFYREYQDRKHGRDRPHILTDELPRGKTHFRRFTVWWRVAHLIGALSIMLLSLTGITVLFADSSWAPDVMGLLGGPRSASILHRIGAIGFMGVFFVHLIYFAYHIGRNLSTFKWFGPNSLIPNWDDLKDAIAMFRWFFGLAPRPVLDHFSYWEKFDYWAPFWGMTIIGVSGVMMWFPEQTASVLPGWVFNVAAIVHGEEAILAIVFLFTVHFFNNHFRPDKFPQDTTMFTGRVPLEVYMHEHKREYDRLVESGELDKYLVDAPSRPMRRGSRILGAMLITTGLTLLTLVIMGFLGI
jgi:cytochrome b subunit of formate dehydrogenase